MPLVTRQANQGRLFVETLVPNDILNGDLWSDLTANVLKRDNNGTIEVVQTSTARVIAVA